MNMHGIWEMKKNMMEKREWEFIGNAFFKDVTNSTQPQINLNPNPLCLWHKSNPILFEVILSKGLSGQQFTFLVMVIAFEYPCQLLPGCYMWYIVLCHINMSLPRSIRIIFYRPRPTTKPLKTEYGLRQSRCWETAPTFCQKLYDGAVMEGYICKMN